MQHAKRVLADWIGLYNQHRSHPSLGMARLCF
ncbi:MULTISPECIES: transposase [Oligella]|nr:MULTISPECIES: transposase [Oligella]